MQFTYEAYRNLISLLKDNDYEVATYTDYEKYRKAVILRHDVDYSLDKSLAMARIENNLGIKSTYFILLTSDFYNVSSKKSQNIIKEIMQQGGHDIGLHFDEMRYSKEEIEAIGIERLIKKEAKLLQDILNIPIRSVSMHRPSKKTLESNLQIEGLINSYSKDFFDDFKYVSDSRMRWREPVRDIIKSQEFDKLHILTHAFWYFEKEKSLNEVVKTFIGEATQDRIDILRENITDLSSILGESI